MAARVSQQIVAALTMRNAPYVLASQLAVGVLGRQPGQPHVLSSQIVLSAIARATNQRPAVRVTASYLEPLTRSHAPVRATEITLNVLTRPATRSRKLALLLPPKLQFIGVAP